MVIDPGTRAEIGNKGRDYSCSDYSTGRNSAPGSSEMIFHVGLKG